MRKTKIPTSARCVGILFAAALIAVTASSCVATPIQSQTSSTAEAAAANSADVYAPGDTRTINIPGTDVSFTLVFVPSGTYKIGSPESEDGRSEDEGPLHDVSLSGFWIGQFELSDDEFAVFRYSDRDADTTAVIGATYNVDGVSRPSPPYEDPAFGMGGSGKPAVGMTQWGALHYAKWLTEKTGVFFRLPTEAEWETACHAGSNSMYGFGDDASKIGDFAWYMDNSEEKLQDIGVKKPNAWGLFDMHGNAAEWTMDEYKTDYYSHEGDLTPTDPWSPPTRLHPRTVRGGSFYDLPVDMRCSSRLESTLNWKRRDPQIPKSFWWNTDAPFLGFRLVAPANGMSAEKQLAFWTLVLGE